MERLQNIHLAERTCLDMKLLEDITQYFLYDLEVDKNFY